MVEIKGMPAVSPMQSVVTPPDTTGVESTTTVTPDDTHEPSDVVKVMTVEPAVKAVTRPVVLVTVATDGSLDFHSPAEKSDDRVKEAPLHK